MLDRGTASFTLATTAVGLALLGGLQWLLMVGEYWTALIGPAVAALLAAAVWLALRRICTGAGRAGAHAAALAGILLLCAWSFFGISFGGTVAIPSALLLMIAHAVVPTPR